MLLELRGGFWKVGEGRAGRDRGVVVSCLFEEVEEIFAWNILEDKEEVGGGVKGFMQSDDVGVQWKRLVDGNLDIKAI